MTEPFAIWITGLPASGKSTLAVALAETLARSGVPVARLESDALRPTLAPGAGYDEAGRDAFYAALLERGLEAIRGGACVLFDATANRRRYRDGARRAIGRFLEVHVDTPLDACVARDPKGIYRRGREGVPGLSAPYEPPDAPDLVVHGDRESPDAAASRVVALLLARGWLTGNGKATP